MSVVLVVVALAGHAWLGRWLRPRAEPLCATRAPCGGVLASVGLSLASLHSSPPIPLLWSLRWRECSSWQQTARPYMWSRAVIINYLHIVWPT